MVEKNRFPTAEERWPRQGEVAKIDILPESNKIYNDDNTYKVIDRIYGDIFGGLKLILKNGKTYRSKIEKKSIKLEDGTLGYVYYADEKWFDRMGMPIEKPKNLVTREKDE